MLHVRKYAHTGDPVVCKQAQEMEMRAVELQYQQRPNFIEQNMKHLTFYRR